MCVVSMVGDHFAEKWNPFIQPQPSQPVLPGLPPSNPIVIVPASEFEQLKKDVAEMKELLKKAKLYDEQTNQKDCENEEKVAILKAMAKHFGVSLEEIFGKEKV